MCKNGIDQPSTKAASMPVILIRQEKQKKTTLQGELSIMVMMTTTVQIAVAAAAAAAVTTAAVTVTVIVEVMTIKKLPLAPAARMLTSLKKIMAAVTKQPFFRSKRKST